MDHEPEPLPAFLADVELVEPTPDVERAIAEAEEAVAAGRTIRFGSDEEFEAFLAGVAWRARQARA